MCEVTEMAIDRKKVACPFRFIGETLPWVKERWTLKQQVDLCGFCRDVVELGTKAELKGEAPDLALNLILILGNDGENEIAATSPASSVGRA